VRRRTHCQYEGANPYSDEEIIAEEVAEDVRLVVNLARVEFVEQRHGDESTEHHRVVHVFLWNLLVVVGIIHVEQLRPFNTYRVRQKLRRNTFIRNVKFLVLSTDVTSGASSTPALATLGKLFTPMCSCHQAV